MKITRINKVKSHRVMQNFAWPSALADFARFNLIYGWNGSGKTTLSNLFRHIEKKADIAEGECEFYFDSNPRLGNSFSNGSGLPRVKVFNREFVEANVFTIEAALTPIFFLGENSVEKQKEIETLKKALEVENQKAADKQRANGDAINALDDFCQKQAKAVKDLLSSSPANSYNNYNKSHFKQASETQIKPGSPSKLLTENKKNELKQQKESKPKDKLTDVSLTLPDLDKSKQFAKDLLAKTVVSQIMDELTKDSGLSEWVQHGLELHTGEHTSNSCRFCGQAFPKERMVKLEAHFNDEYNRFLASIDAAVVEIGTMQTSLSSLFLPGKTQLYDHLAADYVKARDTFQSQIAKIIAYLEAIKKTLKTKRAKPFEAMDIEQILTGKSQPDVKTSTSTLAEITSSIAKHNTDTDNFTQTLSDAREALKECLVAESLDEFKKKAALITQTEGELKALQAGIKTTTEKIGVLEREIIEHRKPAEQLNDELRSYLGRDELKFEVKETGYQITRNGQPALNLSEGEKTAIAFLYFLKSLQDKGFDLANDIVVIDDPVSSLDANALFCAFGYMKERTKDAGQIFILTHNFGFFRQVKNWFNYLPDQKKKDPSKHPARFYMLETEITGAQRNAALKPLDPLLHEYDSEYHYLFKKVHEEANRSVKRNALEEYYAMPNIARRLLEAFLAFRFPVQSGELKQQLDLVSFDPAKKAKILRFLHTYSHDGKISEPEHDLSILAETQQILKDLLDLLTIEDPKHVAEMVKVLSP